MAKQYKVNSEFVSIDEQKGTLYNTGSTDAEVVSETNPTKGEGLVLRSGLTVPFASGVLVRSMDDDDPAIINVVDFKVSGEGGAAENTTATGVKTYASGTAYTKNDLVAYGSNLYLVVKDYTADTVENDLTAGNIVQVDAATATKLATPRTIALSGDATGSATFDGSGDATIAAKVSKIGGTAISNFIKTLLDDGDAATARATLGAPSTTGANASGSWNINAATATKLATARTIALSGDATGSATFDGSGNATIATTLAREVGLTNLIPDNAAAHNAIYRGKALGAAVTAAQWAAIKAGTFDDLFIGDYWTIGGVNWRIAAFDYWLRCGDDECKTHHVVIVPDTNLAGSKMDSTNTTTGGYVGSDFYTGTNDNGKKIAVSNVNAAFGSAHILSHREHLTNAVTNGKPTGTDWYDSTVELMNEVMVYGSVFFEPNPNGQEPWTYCKNLTIDKSQLPLFAHDHSRIRSNGNWWLRSVVSPTCFAQVDALGFCSAREASRTYNVRPAFGIKQS